MTNKIIKFSKALTNKHSEVFDNTIRNIWFNLVNYIINSKYRKSVFLINWLRTQVSEAKEQSNLINIAESIPTKKEPDEQIIEILKWVNLNVTYVGDSIKWNMLEKWQTAQETATPTSKLTLTGDCEDMHILIYVLARLKGIPENRMLLWCGNVQSSPTAYLGGHCSLLYKPQEYPLNFVFIDACYYPNLQQIFNRTLIFLDGTSLMEFRKVKDAWITVTSKYKYTWFVFNERFSTTKYTLKP